MGNVGLVRTLSARAEFLHWARRLLCVLRWVVAAPIPLIKSVTYAGSTSASVVVFMAAVSVFIAMLLEPSDGAVNHSEYSECDEEE